jgi:CDP-glycerol glycerophosphotransferase (TagB/SpsB family)
MKNFIFHLYKKIIRKLHKILFRSSIKLLDALLTKNSKFWCFPVCPFSGQFNGNLRAVFELIKDDKEITKIVLVRDKQVIMEGFNVIILKHDSFWGIYYLIKSKIIFLTQSVSLDISIPLSSKKRLLINLWHGIPLKKIKYAALGSVRKHRKQYKYRSGIKFTICSSGIDHLAMSAAFYPIDYHSIWLTGLPRNDFILAKEGDLPKDFIKQIATIKSLIGDKKLILFTPTFRNDQENTYYKFSYEEKESLKTLLDDNNCILGIREHMADSAQKYSSQLLEYVPSTSLSIDNFPDIEMLYRVADILITDYSSSFIDFTLTGKPSISFAFDLEKYIKKERGMFYDINMVFPGDICENFQDLLTSLQKTIDGDFDKEKIEFTKKFFFTHVDHQNSRRVVDKINDVLKL